MARCPFSLSRVIKLTDECKVLYRTGKSAALAFPILGNEKLAAGIKRNFEMFEPLDFLAEVTQHIPNRGEHQTPSPRRRGFVITVSTQTRLQACLRLRLLRKARALSPIG